MAEFNSYDELQKDRLRLQAQSILYQDGIRRGDLKVDSAMAEFIANNPEPGKHKEAYEDMSLVGQLVEGLGGGFQGAKIGEAYLDQMDATDDLLSVREWNESNRSAENDREQGFEDAAAVDPKFNERNLAAREKILDQKVAEYKRLLAESVDYVQPKAMSRTIERAKGKGFFEGLGIAAEEFFSGDVSSNFVYLVSSSLGAMAPGLAAAALTTGGVGALVRLPLAATTLSAAVMGAWDARATYASELQERLRAEGVDLTDPEEWKKFIENGAKLQDIRNAASGKAAVIGGMTALSMGAASHSLHVGDIWRRLRKAPEYNPQTASLGARMMRGADEVVTGATVQGLMGAGGEVLGSLAIGETPSGADTFWEFVGEFGGGPTEMATQSLATINQYHRDQEAAEQAQVENKAHQQITAAANAIGQKIGDSEALDNWAKRVGKDKQFLAFAQDLVKNGQAEALAEVNPELANKIVEAAEEGTTVDIPAGDIISIATKDQNLANAILEDCRTSADGMSPRQAEEFLKNGQAEADAMFEKTAKKFKASVQQVKSAHNVAQRIKKELIAAGTQDFVAAAQVKPLEMYLARRAAQLGVDPEEIVSAMNLRVVRNDQGVNEISLKSQLSPSITGPLAVKKGLARDSRYIYQPPSLERLMSNPKQFEANLEFMKNAAGMKGAIGNKRTPKSISEAIINRMVDNLLWLHDKMQPKTRDRSKLWYDGAHRAAVAWANRYGLHVRQTAAAIAIFSPQTNWFNNMSCAERTMDMIFGERETKANEPMMPLLESYCKGKDAFRLEDLKTKTLGELIQAGDLRTVALWCKAFDNANNDKRIRVQTPEGGIGDWFYENRVWLGVDRQARAISVLIDGSVDNIDHQIGNEFKVRDFYNNIYDPTNAAAATIDTHAVGANLFSVMSGEDVDVKANFGTQKGTVSSSQTGQSGTYAFHYEALKRAAEKRGLLPREMQSITWEAVRSLFGENQKPTLRPKVQAVWARHDAGEITAEQARNEIFELAGGFNPISWDNEQTPYNDTVQDSYDRSKVKLPTPVPPKLEPTLGLEAAPHPDDEKRLAVWNKLTPTEQYEVTKEVVAEAMQMASEILEARTGDYGMQVGGYEGAVNYSISAKVYDPNKAVQVAALAAYLLRQESALVVSEIEGKGMFKAGVIQIRLPDGFTPEQIAHLYKEGIDKAGSGRMVIGMSTANGIMNIVLSEGDDSAKILKAIREKLNSELFASHHFDVFYEDAFAAFPTPTDYQNDSNNSQEASKLGATSRNDDIRSRRAKIDRLRDRLINDILSQRSFQQSDRNDFGSNGTLDDRIGRQGTSGNSRGTPNPIKRYGQPREGSISVVGVHYSGESRSVLDTDHYGSGMKGAEARRLAGAPDLKQRLYFYVDEGNGIKPESGVGAYKHAVNLNNIYDITADPLGIYRKAIAQAMDEGALYTADVDERQNYAERAIKAAGFDGYYRKGAQGSQGVVCLLGEHIVEVEEYGAESQATAQAVAPKSAAKMRYMLTPSEWKLVPALRVLAKALNTQYGPDTVFVGSDNVVFSETVADEIAKMLPRAATNSFYQHAYNGGPTKHTKFDVSKVGSGLGTRYFGWGMYFSNKKEIAEEYRKAALDKQGAGFSFRRQGRVFKVEIPDNDKLLDWDKPYEEQPQAIKEAISRMTKDFLETADSQLFNYIGLSVADKPAFEAVMRNGNVGFDFAVNEIVIDYAKRALNGEKIQDLINMYAEKAMTTNGSTVTESDNQRVDTYPESSGVGGWFDVLTQDKPVKETNSKTSERVKRMALKAAIERTLYLTKEEIRKRIPYAMVEGDSGENFYKRLEKSFMGKKDADKLASLKLNEYGIPGITYRDGGNFTGGDQRAFVIFNNDAIQILEYWQDEDVTRGAYTPNTTGTDTGSYAGTIELMEKADKSTFLHESSHFFLDMDMMLAGQIANKYSSGKDLTEGEREFLTNLGGFLQWGQREGVINLGVDDSIESVMRAARQWATLSTNEQRAMHELFANGFEAYLMTGHAPSNSVRDLFERFKEWLLDVYATATKKPRPISKEVEKLYALMFATEQEVAEVEAANGMIPMFDLEFEREEEEKSKNGLKLSKEEKREMRKLHREAQLEAKGIVSKAVAGVMNYYVKLRDSAANKIIKANQKRVEQRIKALREEPRFVAYDILTGGLKREDGVVRMKLNADLLLAEGFDEHTIYVLGLKGFVYDGTEHAKFISPNSLLKQTGAEDLHALVDELLSTDRAKANSPLAKARKLFGWEHNYKLNVRDLMAHGIKAEKIGQLLEAGLAIDPRAKANTGSAQDLATACGHDNAVELIAELMDIQDPKTEAASQIAAEIQMETGETPERYTDLQSNLAAHNKARSRFLTAEYNAIARMLGQRQLAVYAAREYAKKKIESMRLGDVHASAYIAAEKRCARDAERAFVKGDFQSCLDAKRGQILNHEMARIALEVEDKMVKARRAAKRALKSKTLYKPYQRLLARLVGNHNLTDIPAKLKQASDDEVDSLIEELTEEGTPVEGLEGALSSTTEMEEMTVGEAKNYLAAVKELETIARNRLALDKLLANKRADEAIEEGKAALADAVKAQGTKKPVNETLGDKWSVLKDSVSRAFFGHIKAQTLCRIFDQNEDNGFFWNLFIRSANECANFENTERAKVTQMLDDILSPVFGKKGAFEQDKRKIGNKMMSKGARFAAACNMGNASNFKRLIDGEPDQWTSENIQALQESLTAEEWQAVQKVWDLLESYRPLIAEKQMRVYGEEPEWIEAQPLTVQTADGQTLTLRGGYYPVKYDPKASGMSDSHDMADKAKQEMRGAFQSQTTNRSFTKPRVKEIKGHPLLLNMDGAFSGLTDVIHDLAWHEWLIETGRVLRGVHGRDTGLSAAIRETYGADAARLFNEWRTNIAEGDRVSGGLIETLIGGKAGISLMGWSPMSALIQLTGIGYIVPRCGGANTMKALGMVLSNPGTRASINEVSPMMKNRALTINRQVSEIRNKINSGNIPWYKKYAYSMLLAVQGFVDTVCWMAAYNKAMQDPAILNDANPDATAIAVADQAVVDTQSSGDVHNMSRLENDANMRILTVFYSWANTALNQAYAIHKGENDRVAALAKLTWMAVVMPTIEKLIRESLKAEDDEDDEEIDMMKILRTPLGASVEYHFGLFIGLREVAGAAGNMVTGERGFGYGGPAGTRGIGAVNKAFQTASTTSLDNLGWSQVSTAIDVTGAFTGIPSAQINRTIKGLRAIESGQAEGIDALLAPVFGFKGRIKD